MACAGFRELMIWQADRMAAAIQEHKWFLSEAAHSDVGIVEAETDFLKSQKRCFCDWRSEYCGGLCSQRKGCDLAALFFERDKQEAE